MAWHFIKINIPVVRACVSMPPWVCSVLPCPFTLCQSAPSLDAHISDLQGWVCYPWQEQTLWKLVLKPLPSHPRRLGTASRSIFVILVIAFSHSDKNLKLICSICLFTHLFSAFFIGKKTLMYSPCPVRLSVCELIFSQTMRRTEPKFSALLHLYIRWNQSKFGSFPTRRLG